MTNKEAQITINAIKFMLDNAQYSEDVEEALNMAISALTNERTETHAFDLIDRQAAISLPVKPKEDRYFQTQNLDDAYDYGWLDLQRCIEKLPPAQPEIIYCKKCKHWTRTCGDEQWGLGDCDVFDKHLVMCNGYCAWAERQEE